MKKDYADRSAHFVEIPELHHEHWHSEVILVRKGFIAMIVLIITMLVLSAVTYAAQPAAKLAISSQSLVDQAGEE